MNEDLLYGYESPITVMMTDEIVKRLHDEVNKEVYRVIQGVGIHVDKDELIKALAYDRGQYARGYLDGLRSAIKHGAWRFCMGTEYPYCSECGCESLSRVPRPYCQFCGAKMDKEDAQ